ncbi:MAG: hypothetical protein KDE09_14305 [Anaerolineales bacterium]|nr:hypothetical protein [Anaerolineales bacterium]
MNQQDKDWLENVDMNWIDENLKVLSRIQNGPQYVFDVYAFEGLLSFSEYFIRLADGEIEPRNQIDLRFLDDPTLPHQIFTALNLMLNDDKSQENLLNSWQYFQRKIEQQLGEFASRYGFGTA